MSNDFPLYVCDGAFNASPTKDNDELTLDVRLGTKHVIITAPLDTYPNKQNVALVNQLCLAVLVQLYAGPSERDFLELSEWPITLDKMMPEAEQLLKAPNLDEYSPEIQDLVGAFKRRDVTWIENPAEFIGTPVVNVRSLNFLERVILIILKIWNGFIALISGSSNSAINRLPDDDSILEGLEGELFNAGRMDGSLGQLERRMSPPPLPPQIAAGGAARPAALPGSAGASRSGSPDSVDSSVAEQMRQEILTGRQSALGERKDEVFGGLYEVFIDLTDAMIKSLFEHPDAPLSGDDFYTTQIATLKKLLGSGDPEADKVQVAAGEGAEEGEPPFDFGEMGAIRILRGIVRSTVEKFVDVTEAWDSIDLRVAPVEGDAAGAAPAEDKKGKIQKLLAVVFHYQLRPVDQAALEQYLVGREGENPSPEQAEARVSVLELINGPLEDIQTVLNENKNNNNAIFKKTLVNAMIWQLEQDVLLKSELIKVLFGINLEELSEHLNVVFAELQNIVRVLTPEELKAGISFAAQLLGKKVSIKLAGKFTTLLEQVNYTDLLDKGVSKIYGHLGHIHTAYQGLISDPTNSGRCRLWGPEDIGEGIKDHLPKDALFDKPEALLVEMTEELMPSLMSTEEMQELCTEVLNGFNELLLDGIEDEEEGANPVITAARKNIATALRGIFGIAKEHSLSEVSQASLLTGVQDFATTIIEPAIEKFVKDKIAKDLLAKISNPDYLNDLCQDKLFPVFNSMFIQQRVSDIILKYTEAEVQVLFEEEADTQALQAKIKADFIADISAGSSFVVEREGKIDKEIDQSIQEFLVDLRKKLNAITPELKAGKTHLESVREVLSAEDEAEAHHTLSNNIYWNFLHRFIFDIGELLKGSWTRSALETDYVRNKIAVTVSDLLNPLRGSHKLLIGSTAESLKSLTGSMGDMVFGDSVIIDDKKRKEITANLALETRFFSQLMHKILCDNIGRGAGSVLPSPDAVHTAVQNALTRSFSNQDINQNLFLLVFEQIKIELEKAAGKIDPTQQAGEEGFVDVRAPAEEDEEADDGAGVGAAGAGKGRRKRKEAVDGMEVGPRAEVAARSRAIEEGKERPRVAAGAGDMERARPPRVTRRPKQTPSQTRTEEAGGEPAGRAEEEVVESANKGWFSGWWS